MITSDVITSKCSDEHTGKVNLEKLSKIWENARYLISTNVVDENQIITNASYYKGHSVKPAPRSNIKVCGRLRSNDLATLSSQGVRLVNYDVTDDSDSRTMLSEWSIMDESEADDYERIIIGSKDNGANTLASTASVETNNPNEKKQVKKRGRPPSNPI